MEEYSKYGDEPAEKQQAEDEFIQRADKYIHEMMPNASPDEKMMAAEQFLQSEIGEEAYGYWMDAPGGDMGHEFLEFATKQFVGQQDQDIDAMGIDPSDRASSVPYADGRPPIPPKGNKGDLPTTEGYDNGAEFPNTDVMKVRPNDPEDGSYKREGGFMEKSHNVKNKDQSRMKENSRYPWGNKY